MNSRRYNTQVHVDFSTNISFDKVAYMPEIQKEYGPGYDNWAYGSNDDSRPLTGFSQNRLDRDGNTITTPNVQTYYTWGAKYDPTKTVTYFDGNERAFTPIDHNQWADIFRTGVNQTYNLSVINSTDRNSMRFSYTYNDVQAMQYNSNNYKHNFNLSGTYDVAKTVKLNYTATFTSQYIKNRPYRISRLTNNYSGMFGGFTDVAYIRDHTVTSLGYMNSQSSVNSGGTTSTLTPNEQFLYSPMGSTSLMSEYFWQILGKTQEEDHNRFIGSVNPTWEIIPGLILSGRIATDYTTDKIENKNNTENAHIFSTNGTYSDYYGLTNSRYSVVYGDVMFDSKYTDFSIAKGPFKNNPKADVAKYVFDAFRKDNFMIGTYFSKPDWHSQDYWWDYYATPNRNVNYNIKQHPERWEAFKSFTHNQIGELMSNYGSVDILWLDGGWVAAENKQDIDMPKIAEMARVKQPGLLVVDRTIHAGVGFQRRSVWLCKGIFRQRQSG